MEHKAETRNPAQQQRGSFLNSPFILTIVGSLGVALITTIAQYNADWHRLESTQRSQRFQTKTKILDAFANTIPKYLEQNLSKRKREIYLHKYARKPKAERVPYGDGRSFNETVLAWERDRAVVLSHKSPSVLIAQAKAHFDSEALVPLNDDLSDAFRHFEKTDSPDTLSMLFRSIDTQFQKAIQLMSLEMKTHYTEES